MNRRQVLKAALATSRASVMLFLASVSVPAHAEEAWPRPDERIACGPLVLEVYVSRTAQIFHVVDQISAWDNACHGQYREHMELSTEDKTLLERYAAVRAKRRWGQGLEQAFYTPLDLAAAVQAGTRGNHLRADEAHVIVPVLEHFAPRVDRLLDTKRDILKGAFRRVDRRRLTQAAGELAGFAGVRNLVLPTFPLASPAPGGGGMDGGRLRWELASNDIPFSVLLHEVSHGFFMEKEKLLQLIVERTPGLTMTLLNEGLAYAMAPGLYGDGEGDNLRYNVAKDLERGVAWDDPTYGRQRTYALALRPAFAEALRGGGKIEDFLPRARDIFLAIREVLEAKASPGPPKLAIAGPAGDAARARLSGSKYSLWIHSFNHAAVENYARCLEQMGAGDLFVLLVSGEDKERIPPMHASLSPLDPAEIDRELARGKQIARERETARRVRVVLLAAPTTAKLRELVRNTPHLDVGQ